MRAAHLVKEARRRGGLSQRELAARVGTTQSALARIEAGRTSPSFDRVVELIRACGLDLEWRLVPSDDHDLTLAEGNRTLGPTERLEKMLALVRLRGLANPGHRRDAG